MKHFSERALLTDLYELTMLQAYFLQGMNERASFEFFVRELPKNRNFLLAAGLQQVVDTLAALRFDEDDLAWLRDCGQFDARFIASLEDLRFTGDVDAMPEGTAFFANEPILRITAPLREAQFVESRVMNLLHYESLVASKAARCVFAAPGKRLIDFGLRRAHGAEAAALSARASYIAGFDGTATAIAAPLFGIPVFGTMAHSFVQTFDHETDAFAAFAQAFPDNTILLIDTYDTEAAARQVARLAQWLREEENIRVKAVRIDSGDLGVMAQRVRTILDDGGFPEIGIFASGNLDEYRLQALVEQGMPIDGFGIGTRMNTSADAPYLDCAYKLVDYAGVPRRKRSSGKMTWPGCKQVFRRRDGHGVLQGDTIAKADEQMPGETLLKPIMRGGALLQALPSLSDTRMLAAQQLVALPAGLHGLGSATYSVGVAQSLHALVRQSDAREQAMEAEDCARWGFEDE